MLGRCGLHSAAQPDDTPALQQRAVTPRAGLDLTKLLGRVVESVVDAGTTLVVWEWTLAADLPKGLSRCYSLQGTGCRPAWVTRYAGRTFDDPTRQGRVDCRGSIGAGADRPTTEHDRS